MFNNEFWNPLQEKLPKEQKRLLSFADCNLDLLKYEQYHLDKKGNLFITFGNSFEKLTFFTT